MRWEHKYAFFVYNKNNNPFNFKVYPQYTISKFRKILYGGERGEGYKLDN